MEKRRNLTRTGILTYKICLQIWTSIVMSGLSATDLEEPFVLPFGPKHGDVFTDKNSDRCSVEIPLSRTFKFGSQTVSSFWACNDAYIDFDEASNADMPYYFELGTTSVISIGLYDYELEDDLFDYMCVDQGNYMEHYDRDDVCEFYWGYAHNMSALYDADLDIIYGWNPANDLIAATWNTLEFTRGQVNVRFDDTVSKMLMGEQTTKYVNLGANVMRREISNQSDFDLLDDLINSKHSDFAASFGLVITWYKIMDNEMEAAYFNSYQLIVTCDDNQTPSTTIDDRCFVIFDYYEIQFYEALENFYMRAGLKLGLWESNPGIMYELPFSGTQDLPKLQQLSNFGVPGLWVYEISQLGSLPYVSGGFVDKESFKQFCPSVVFFQREHSIYSSNQFALLGPCGDLLPVLSELLFIFTGKVNQRVNGPIATASDQYIAVPVPSMWTSVETVKVELLVFNKTVVFEDFFYFYSPEQVNQQIPSSVSVGKIQLGAEIHWNQDSFGTDSVSQISAFRAEHNESHVIGFDPLGELSFTLNADDSGFVFEEDTELFTVFKIVSSSSQEYWTYPVVSEQELGFCHLWLSERTTKTADCLGESSTEQESISTVYPCPVYTSAVPNDFPHLVEQSDAWWARSEVEYGLTGWTYDPCCSDVDPDLRSRLNNSGICSSATCEFNPGADFCITSPPYACAKSPEAYLYNQCCYSSEGTLLTKDSQSAGRLALSDRSTKNILDAFLQELTPFKACCLKEDLCDDFNSVRPTVSGFYQGSAMASVEFGGHFRTADGNTFSFEGFGVYTLLTLQSPVPIKIQISMRPLDQGSSVSGFAIEANETHLEVFLSASEALKIYVNNKEVSSVLTEYEVSGIYVKDTSPSNLQILFRFIEIGLSVNVAQMGSYLNLYLGLPGTLHGSKGLTGLFDRNRDNDFQSIDGAIHPSSSDDSFLHEAFAETWKVSDSELWLFHNSQSAIESELGNEGLFPSYEIPENVNNTYFTQCEGDRRCLLDVHLSDDPNTVLALYGSVQGLQIKGTNAQVFADLNAQLSNSKRFQCTRLLHMLGIISIAIFSLLL